MQRRKISNEDTVRLDLRFSKDTHRKLKILAAKLDKSISLLVEETIQKLLKEHKDML